MEYSRKSNPKNVWPLKKAASLCTGIANHAIESDIIVKQAVLSSPINTLGKYNGILSGTSFPLDNVI